MGKDIEGERGKILAQPGPDKGKRLAYNREGVCNQARSQVRSERRLIKIFKNVEIKGDFDCLMFPGSSELCWEEENIANEDVTATPSFV